MYKRKWAILVLVFVFFVAIFGFTKEYEYKTSLKLIFEARVSNMLGGYISSTEGGIYFLTTDLQSFMNCLDNGNREGQIFYIGGINRAIIEAFSNFGFACMHAFVEKENPKGDKELESFRKVPLVRAYSELSFAIAKGAGKIEQISNDILNGKPLSNEQIEYLRSLEKIMENVQNTIQKKSKLLPSAKEEEIEQMMDEQIKSIESFTKQILLLNSD